MTSRGWGLRESGSQDLRESTEYKIICRSLWHVFALRCTPLHRFFTVCLNNSMGMFEYSVPIEKKSLKFFKNYDRILECIDMCENLFNVNDPIRRSSKILRNFDKSNLLVYVILPQNRKYNFNELNAKFVWVQFMFVNSCIFSCHIFINVFLFPEWWIRLGTQTKVQYYWNSTQIQDCLFKSIINKQSTWDNVFKEQENENSFVILIYDVILRILVIINLIVIIFAFIYRRLMSHDE